MTTDPDESWSYPPTSPLAQSGKFGSTVIKAAEFAGLPAEVVGLLGFAAAVTERHAAGYGPQDGEIGMLRRELGTFVAAQREIALARRRTAA